MWKKTHNYLLTGLKGMYHSDMLVKVKRSNTDDLVPKYPGDDIRDDAQHSAQETVVCTKDSDMASLQKLECDDGQQILVEGVFSRTKKRTNHWDHS